MNVAFSYKRRWWAKACVNVRLSEIDKNVSDVTPSVKFWSKKRKYIYRETCL